MGGKRWTDRHINTTEHKRGSVLSQHRAAEEGSSWFLRRKQSCSRFKVHVN